MSSIARYNDGRLESGTYKLQRKATTSVYWRPSVAYYDGDLLEILVDKLQYATTAVGWRSDPRRCVTVVYWRSPIARYDEDVRRLWFIACRRLRATTLVFWRTGPTSYDAGLSDVFDCGLIRWSIGEVYCMPSIVY